MRVKTVERSASGPTVSRIPLLLIACDRHADLHVVSLPGEYRRYRLHQDFPSQMGTGEPLAITVGIEALALGLTIVLKMWMYFDNKKRNKAQGMNRQSKGVPTEALADGLKNSLFRHFYKFSFQVHSNNVVEYSF